MLGGELGVEERLEESSPDVWAVVVFDAVLFTKQLRADELTDIAESDPGPGGAARAAKTVVREALWTNRIEHERRLSRSRHRDVRALALTGFMRGSRPRGPCPPACCGTCWPIPDRPARRRAAYRLLQRHDRATKARAAILLAGDPHPLLASRGVADTTRIARFWRRGRARPLDPDPRRAADLRQLIDNAPAAIGADTTRLLLEQLEHAPRA